MKRRGLGRTLGRTLASPLVVLAGVVLLSGCAAAKRDSVIVGAVPDDYRTNHPIVIAETDQQIDLPVGVSARGMIGAQRTALEGFLDRYDPRAGGQVTMLVPVGSANEAAASRTATDFTGLMRKRGVPLERIAVLSYRAPSADTSPPIRLSYPIMKASTGPCGRWPEDILQSAENKHYANFGCSYQNNLAAQIANPADLLGPRAQTEIDAENRGNAIGEYKDRGISRRFQREVNY